MAFVSELLHRIIPERTRVGYLHHLVRTRTHGRVRAGPFAGMRYIDSAFGSAYLPKLLGIYERELNPCIEQVCALNFPLIVVIGAAEGYYAVGLARRNAKARVIAFEIAEEGRAALKEMAELNDVTARVDLRGKCELGNLQSALAGADRSLVVCDVEGYEEILLKPDAIPALTRAHLLVEMHDFVHPGITERLTGRFALTHHVRRIWQEPRRRRDLPYYTLGTMLLPKRYLDWAVSEWRPVRMSWLWMEPREVNGAAT